MSKIVGIDLGTTNSVVAIVENGDGVVIPNAEGGRTTPSVVAFTKNGERLVGQTARRQAVVNPENTISSIKRFMGRRADEVADEPVSFEIKEGPSGDARVHIPLKNKTYSPQEISAMTLGKLKADAEAYLGEPVTQAVITVPAYFNDSQRQATKDAGKIAGLEVMRIINEPTAAALAYGLDKKESQTILVFDLGGGTFDVSVLEVGDGVVEVKATAGDTHLGGDDYDQLIVNWIADEFKTQEGIDLKADRQALQRLKEAGEKAKIELSSTMETEVNLPFITADAGGPKHLQMRLTRSKFEQLSDELTARLRAPFEAALNDADLSTSEIDEVVLVGGSSRMPMVQELVREVTGGKEPHKGVNPDEVVAVGAALQGGVLQGDVKDILLLDVTPLTLGIETLGGVATPIIERNTTVPVRKSQTFSTAENNQTAVTVQVLQGERPMASDNASLGQFNLEGLPPAPRGLPQIEVTFDIDANGILHVSAQDKATGREQSVTITASTNLDSAEVDRMVREAEINKAADDRRRDLIQARNEGDSLAYSVERTLQEAGDKVDSADRQALEQLVGNLRQSLDGEDVTAIRSAMEQLQQASYRLSEQLYATPEAANGAAANGTNGHNSHANNGQPESDDVVEGEFRSV
ncbi:MAG: molecular chaperone DnaK [Chloroflexota bacterium]|nr:molecular chaperone DnaK [Chloroflexota bacterium]